MNHPDPERRQQAAQKITDLRKNEQQAKASGDYEHLYRTDRDAIDYDCLFQGYEAVLRYAQGLPKQAVLGIGEGQGLAFSQIAEEYQDQLRFEATVLNAPEDTQLETVIGKENLHITSAEVLRGVAPESISAVLAQFSLAYADPVLSVARLHTVLEPGGIVKATFHTPGKTSGHGLRSPEDFTKEWYKLGYDVRSILVTTKETSPTGKPILPRTIIIAIKPSHPEGRGIANTLYEEDFAAYMERAYDRKQLEEQQGSSLGAKIFKWLTRR